MTQKTKNIIGWTLTGILTLLFLSSAYMKLFGGEAAIQMASGLGISVGALKLIALIELASVVLFIIPRTGLLGTLLLAAYLGGAIATHLEHQQPVITAVVVEALLWITATLRFSELSKRLTGSLAQA